MGFGLTYDYTLFLKYLCIRTGNILKPKDLLYEYMDPFIPRVPLYSNWEYFEAKGSTIRVHGPFYTLNTYGTLIDPLKEPHGHMHT